MWLTDALQDDQAQAQAGPSTLRLRPNFGSRIEEHPSLQATSKALAIFPPSRSSGHGSARANRGLRRSKGTNEELDDISDEVLESLAEDSSAPRLKSGAKLLVAPYAKDADKLLIIHVGGPDDRHLCESLVSDTI